MEQVIITVARSVFLFSFLLSVVLWPRFVRRPALLVFGHTLFAASLIVIPIAMLYYELTWDDPMRDTLRFFASVRMAHYSSLVAGFAFAVAAVIPFPGRHESLRTETDA